MSLLSKIKLLEVPYKIESENIIPNILYFDPIIKLYSELEEIQILEKYLSKLEIIELIFNNKKAIHINLYKEEKYIKIISDENTKSLAYCFYLSLAIGNASIINYIYNIKYIEDIFKIMEKENSLKQIILSKIICILIYNYKQSEDYKENEEEELNKKFEICIKNIDNIANLGLGLTADYIKNNEIDIIYCKIISWLIEKNIFQDYDDTYDFISELELETINITNNMLKYLINILNKEDVINNYGIFEMDDLLNGKKINFYYIFFKYILKNDIYIYQIPFFLKNKKNLIQIIKYNYENITKNEKNAFILNFLFGEEHINILRRNKNTNKTQTSLFIEVPDEENDDNNPLIVNAGNYIWVKLLNKSFFTLSRRGYKNIYDFYDIIYKYNGKDTKINLIKFNSIINNEIFRKQKYFEDFLSFSNFLSEIKIIFNNLFEKYDNFNLFITIEFETTFYDGFPNIQCIYKFSQDNKDTISFTDFNLLYNKSYEGFNSLIKEIGQYLDKKNMPNNVEQLFLDFDSLHNIPQDEEDTDLYINGYKYNINDNM